MSSKHWTHAEIAALLTDRTIVRVTLDPGDSAPHYHSTVRRYVGPGQVSYYSDDGAMGPRTEAARGMAWIDLPRPWRFDRVTLAAKAVRS